MTDSHKARKKSRRSKKKGAINQNTNKATAIVNMISGHRRPPPGAARVGLGGSHHVSVVTQFPAPLPTGLVAQHSANARRRDVYDALLLSKYDEMTKDLRDAINKLGSKGSKETMESSIPKPDPSVTQSSSSHATEHDVHNDASKAGAPSSVGLASAASEPWSASVPSSPASTSTIPQTLYDDASEVRQSAKNSPEADALADQFAGLRLQSESAPSTISSSAPSARMSSVGSAQGPASEAPSETHLSELYRRERDLASEVNHMREQYLAEQRAMHAQSAQQLMHNPRVMPQELPMQPFVPHSRPGSMQSEAPPARRPRIEDRMVNAAQNAANAHELAQGFVNDRMINAAQNAANAHALAQGFVNDRMVNAAQNAANAIEQGRNAFLDRYEGMLTQGVQDGSIPATELERHFQD